MRMKSVKMLLTSCLLIAAMALSGCGGAEKKPEAKPDEPVPTDAESVPV